MSRVLVLLILVFCWGCGDSDRVKHPTVASELRRGVDTGKTVASVNGQSIGEGEFRRLWEETPERTAEAVVEDAISREVVTQKALKATLLGDPKVHEFDRKKALVRVMLEKEIQAKHPGDHGDKSVVQAREAALNQLLERLRLESRQERYPELITEQFEMEK